MKLLTFVSLTSTCLAFQYNITELSIKYFTSKGINFVCLLSCENSSVDKEFAKEASNNSIATVKVDLENRPVDYGKIKKCLVQKYTSIGVLLNTKCENVENILIYASKEMFFNAAMKWLIIDQGDRWKKINDSDEAINLNNFKHSYEMKLPILSVLDKLNLSVDGDITVTVQEGPQRVLTLYEVFNYGKIQGGTMKIIKIGEQRPGKGIPLNIINPYKYYRKWNFEELTLRMIIVMSPRVIKFKPDQVSSNEIVPGIAVFTQISLTILQVVSEVHNVRYKYTVVDRWIGNYMQNSTPSVSRSLYFREQDISPILRAGNTFEYVQIVSPPVTSIETRFYYRIPTQGPGKLENQFLRPLSSGVWLCVLVVGVLCVFVLLISSKVEKRKCSIQYAVFSVVASLCQQFFEDSSEMSIRKPTTAGKMTILVTGVSCVLIYNYYTSSVVSWLLSGPPPSLNSLKELLESPLELVFEDVGYTRSWLQLPDYYYNKRNAKIEDELKQKKVLNKKGGPLLVPVEKGIEMVKAGGYAYHTETYNAKILISRSFTANELWELGSLQSMEKTPLYVSLQKDSPYKEFFVWSLLRLLERGIVSCIQNRMKAPDVSSEGSSPRALALGGAAPAFILLGAGYVLGISVMIAERIHYRFQRRLPKSTGHY